MPGQGGPQGVELRRERSAAVAGDEKRVVLRGQPADDRPARNAVMRDEGCSGRSEEHTSELQSLMRIPYAVICLKTKKKKIRTNNKQASQIYKQEQPS